MKSIFLCCLSPNRKPFHLQLYHDLQTRQNSLVPTKRGLIQVGKEEAKQDEKTWLMRQAMCLGTSTQAHMIIKYKEASKPGGFKKREYTCKNDVDESHMFQLS